MLTAIALDDEPIALEVIKRMAANLEEVDLRGCFTRASAAGAYLSEHQVDLVFLDIRMPDISGVEWLKTIAPAPMVIFTTAHSEHAVRSYELNAVDYLLKPFSPARFQQACRKAQDLQYLREKSAAASASSAASATSAETVLFIKTGLEHVKLPIADLRYLQSAGNYVHFFTVDHKITSRLTMQEASERLPAHLFTRIHRSYLVGHGHITKLERERVWIGETALPVGAAFGGEWQQLRELLTKGTP